MYVCSKLNHGCQGEEDHKRWCGPSKEAHPCMFACDHAPDKVMVEKEHVFDTCSRWLEGWDG